MLRILQLLSIGARCTPELRTAIKTMVDQLAADTAKTTTPADDQAVAMLIMVLTILRLY